MKTNRKGILAAGNWIVDRVKIIDQFPQEESLAIIQKEIRGNGGGPYNLLKDLSRLGAPFPLEALGLLGDDPEGRLILEDCQQNGIGTQQMFLTNKAHTSYTDVMTVKKTGKRTFFHYVGSNAHLEEGHFHLEQSQVKIFYLGYVMLLDELDIPDSVGRTGASRILEKAIHLGMQTAVDVVSENSTRFQKVVLPVLPWVDYFFMNEYEAEKISEIPVRMGERLHLENMQKAAEKIVNLGVRRWVFIHFPEGVLACNPKGETIWQGSVQIPAKKIAGKAGAGDALAAGVLLGFHQEWPIRRCLQTGVCVAAASLYDPTCSGSVPRLKACMALGEKYGYRALFNR